MKLVWNQRSTDVPSSAELQSCRISGDHLPDRLRGLRNHRVPRDWHAELASRHEPVLRFGRLALLNTSGGGGPVDCGTSYERRQWTCGHE